MGYRYINQFATAEKISSLLELVDLAAGGGEDANNVFELARKFTHSPPMQACEAMLKQDPEVRPSSPRGMSFLRTMLMP